MNKQISKNRNSKKKASFLPFSVLIIAFVISLFLVSCDCNGKDTDKDRKGEDITTTAENGNANDSEDDPAERITLPVKKL